MPNTKNNKIKSCVTFNVKRHQNIAQEAANTPGLPVGPCTIEIYYNNMQDVRRYINGRLRRIITPGRLVADYFNSTDLEDGMNIARWRIINREMNTPGHIIEEITVKVCPNN